MTAHVTFLSRTWGTIGSVSDMFSELFTKSTVLNHCCSYIKRYNETQWRPCPGSADFTDRVMTGARDCHPLWLHVSFGCVLGPSRMHYIVDHPNLSRFPCKNIINVKIPRFLGCELVENVELTVELSVIWQMIVLVWQHCTECGPI